MIKWLGFYVLKSRETGAQKIAGNLKLYGIDRRCDEVLLGRIFRNSKGGVICDAAGDLEDPDALAVFGAAKKYAEENPNMRFVPFTEGLLGSLTEQFVKPQEEPEKEIHFTETQLHLIHTALLHEKGRMENEGTLPVFIGVYEETMEKLDNAFFQKGGESDDR